MDELAFWRNIAIVVLAVQCLVILVVALAANYLLVRLMNALQGKAERAAVKVQCVSHTVSQKTEQIADKTVQPVLSIQRRVTNMRETLRAVVQPSASRRRRRASHPSATGPFSNKE